MKLHVPNASCRKDFNLKDQEKFNPVTDVLRIPKRYSIEEVEIVNGMLDQALCQLTCLSILEVSPEEFETVYGYFLS